MTRMLTALAVLGVMGATDAPRRTPLQKAPAAAQLQIHAVAFDSHGSPVMDLTRNEIEVWIGIYRVPIESLTAVTPAGEDSGRLFVLLLDDVTLEPEMAPRVREVARTFVTRMAPGDEMAVVALNGDLMESTDDSRRLLTAIDAYRTHPVGLLRADLAGEHVLRTLGSISRQLAERPGRKTIVGIGAVWLFDTPIPPPIVGRDLRPEWIEAMRAMGTADVTLYAIDPGGVGTSRFPGGSSGLARETGGHAFANTNDARGAVERIMREAGSYYAIEVANPPIGRKADLRELDVRVRRGGVTIRARRWLPGRPQ